MRGALANERTYERCIALVPGAQAFDARTKADTRAAHQVAQIEQALKQLPAMPSPSCAFGPC